MALRRSSASHGRRALTGFKSTASIRTPAKGGGVAFKVRLRDCEGQRLRSMRLNNLLFNEEADLRRSHRIDRR